MSAPSAGVSNIRKAKNIPLLVQNEECVCEMHSFNQRPLPPFVYLGKHWRHSRDKLDQASPLRFCILQVIKNWMVGRPRARETIFGGRGGPNFSDTPMCSTWEPSYQTMYTIGRHWPVYLSSRLSVTQVHSHRFPESNRRYGECLVTFIVWHFERQTSQLIMEHHTGCSEDLPAVVAVPASVASAVWQNWAPPALRWPYWSSWSCP